MRNATIQRLRKVGPFACIGATQVIFGIVILPFAIIQADYGVSIPPVYDNGIFANVLLFVVMFTMMFGGIAGVGVYFYSRRLLRR